MAGAYTLAASLGGSFSAVTRLPSTVMAGLVPAMTDGVERRPLLPTIHGKEKNHLHL
jgi:hypothetical protein